MKKTFSTKWSASKQPRKQRKYLANAPIHLKRKFLSINLSKGLKAIQKKKNMVARKGDKVKIMRGKYKGKEGKITKVLIDRKSTRLNSSHTDISRMPSSA